VAGFIRQHRSSEAYKELKVLKFDDIPYVSLKWGYLPIAILTIKCFVSLRIILLN